MPKPNPPAPRPDAPPRRRWPIPWALLIALGVYALLVPVYMYFQYWSTPEYEAVEHLDAARQILGTTGGHGIRRAQLEKAYGELLEVARLFGGDEVTLHELEELNARFEEKGWKIPDELQRRAEALGTLARKKAAEEQPVLAVGLRQRGWDPAAIKAGPGHALWGALFGALLIALIYASIRFSVHRVHEREHLEEVLRTEKEVAELGVWRQGLKIEGIEEPEPKAKKKPVPPTQGPSARPEPVEGPAAPRASSPPPRPGKEPVRPVNVRKRPK